MRLLILILLGLSFSAAADERKSYSSEEVAKHDSPKDCWVVIKDKVYDLTAYLPKHPAPDIAITKYCGKNADKGWETKDKKRPHSRAASKLLARYEIGELAKSVD
jgi:cytochrome b involved in lipid metabolism